MAGVGQYCLKFSLLLMSFSWSFGYREQALGNSSPHTPHPLVFLVPLAPNPEQIVGKQKKKKKKIGDLLLFHRSLGPSLVCLLSSFYTLLVLVILNCGNLEKKMAIPSFSRIRNFFDLIFKLNKCENKWILKYIIEILMKEILNASYKSDY